MLLIHKLYPPELLSQPNINPFVEMNRTSDTVLCLALWFLIDLAVSPRLLIPQNCTSGGTRTHSVSYVIDPKSIAFLLIFATLAYLFEPMEGVEPPTY